MTTDTKKSKDKKSLIRALLFVTLLCLLVFAFTQQYTIIKIMEQSNLTLSEAFTQQTGLTNTYSSLYHQTQIALAKTTSELEATQKSLAETTQMLSQAQEENQVLLSQVSKIQSDTTKVSRELVSLQSKMNQIDTSVNSVEEGKIMLSALRGKINGVKVRIKDLKREAYLAKVAAEKEQDRIALLNGNQGNLLQGFLLRSDAQTERAKASNDVKINVSFYEP